MSKNLDKAPKDIIEARVSVQGCAFETKELLRRADLTDAAKQAEQIAAQYAVEGEDALKSAVVTYRNVANALNDAHDIEGAQAAAKLATAIENITIILHVNVMGKIQK